MKGLLALIALSLTLAPATVDAQVAPVVCVQIDACDRSPLEMEALRSRIALELSLRSGEVGTGSCGADTEVRVSSPCDGSASVEVVTAGRSIARSIDLGEAAGLAWVWALALLVADVVRSAETPPPPRAHVRASSPARDDEIVYGVAEPGPSERPRVNASALGVGASARVYLEVPTFLPGIEIAIAHDWLRVAVSAMATGVSTDLGSIALGMASLEVGVRPLAWWNESVSIVGELSASGGIAYGAGQPARATVSAHDAVQAVIGGSVAARVRWLVDRALVVELAITLGYDALGALLTVGGEGVASLHGARAGLSMAFLLPL